jgi:hypothetical protein
MTMWSLLRAQWDRCAAWAAATLGAVLLIVGYFKVSDTAYPAEQIPYLISAGLAALYLLGLAGALWISADLRDEYAKLEEIASRQTAQEADAASANGSVAAGDGNLVKAAASRKRASRSRG